MKKLYFIFIILLIASTAYAGSHLIRGATATGTQTQGTLFVDGENNHTYGCSFLNSTSITAFTVVLQGSNDNKTTWSDLSTLAYDATDISNKFGMRHADGKPVDWVRLNITALTGTDLDADCYYTRGE